jgi:hypothetical protein
VGACGFVLSFQAFTIAISRGPGSNVIYPVLATLGLYRAGLRRRSVVNSKVVKLCLSVAIVLGEDRYGSFPGLVPFSLVAPPLQP